MNDQDFEKQLREWMGDRAQPLPGELEMLEAAAEHMPARSRWLPELRLSAAVVAAVALAGAAIWVGGELRGPVGAETPTPSPSSMASASVAPTSSESPGLAPMRDIEPAWSAHGQVIAFTRVTPEGMLNIWLMRADGTEPRRLTEGRQPSFSPDGRWIAFKHQPAGMHAAIFRIRIDGADRERLTDDSSDAGNPAWSPDGTTIAFQRQVSDDDPRILLWLMDADGGNQGLLSPGGFDDMAEPAWSLDGDKIAFSTSQDAVVEGREPTPRSIWVVSNMTGTDLLYAPYSQAQGVLRSPTWSADGQRLAWHDENLGLVIDGQATGVLGREPVWSPAGNRLAYSVELPSGAMSIFTATVTDANELVDIVQLTQ